MCFALKAKPNFFFVVVTKYQAKQKEKSKAEIKVQSYLSDERLHIRRGIFCEQNTLDVIHLSRKICKHFLFPREHAPM